MNITIKRNEILLTLLICMTAAASLYLLDISLSSSLWAWLEPKATVDQYPYCETKNLSDLLRQKVNVYTNIFYLFWGLLIILISRRNAKLNPNFSQLLPFFLGGSLIFLFLCSTFFHAAFIKISQRMDVNATDALLLSFVAIAINRFYESKKIEKQIFIGSMAALILCFIIFFFVSGKVIFATLTAILIFFSLLNYRSDPDRYSVPILLMAFIFFGIAFTLHLLDVTHYICSPDSLLQLHSIWHFLTASAAFLIFVYYYKNLLE